MTTASLKHLKRDSVLREALADFSPPTLRREENIALYLCLSIISQQLSTKVARVICDRFLDLFQGSNPTCEAIIAVETAELRSIGLSQSKANYIHNVCTFFIEHQLSDEKLHSMSNEEVIEVLIQIKGVGNWTIQMLLMFAMAREDVFAPDDLGVQQAMIALYRLKPTSKKELNKQLVSISEAWKPYRTHACIALWNWKDRMKKN
jgi:DNA-3-methyladenine glycosylase II